MNDSEINRALALAIGWMEEDIVPMGTVAFPELCSHVFVGDTWKRFDYRDPAVIWPIAERFNAFPRASSASGGELWFARVRGPIQLPMLEFSKADTAAKAVALAVIKAKEPK